MIHKAGPRLTYFAWAIVQVHDGCRWKWMEWTLPSFDEFTLFSPQVCAPPAPDLSTRSFPVFRSTVFPEWYQDRIEPWVQ